MDAAAVSAARGLAAKVVRARDVVMVAGLFGGFQAAMPVLGWLLGSWLGPAVAEWDHWIAFVVLVGIGGKMLLDARRGGGEELLGDDLFAWRVMLMLGVATSIDAFAVGVTLPMLGARLGVAVVTIGVTTAVLSVVGLWAGRRAGAMLGRRLDALGGVVLIGLGLKILVEHLAG